MPSADLLELARTGDVRALSRLLSLAEDAPDSMSDTVAHAIAESTGSSAHVVGVTGPPGSGKSTLTSALIAHYRELGKRVGVLAVDPSSPFSGGALLGDRIRMLAHTSDDGVYIRSMASRGHLGGLAAASLSSIAVLMVAGFDVVLVETVGVGQSEVEVASTCDTTVVLSTPGTGDGIQAVKAGILEVADVLVVNKADQPGTDVAVRQLRNALRLSALAPGGWATPVVSCVASTTDGVDTVVDALEQHWAWLAGGRLVARRKARTRHTVRTLAEGEFKRCLEVSDDLVSRVGVGDFTISRAVREVIRRSFL